MFLHIDVIIVKLKRRVVDLRLLLLRKLCHLSTCLLLFLMQVSYVCCLSHDA